MSIQTQPMRNLVEKIRSLPPERIAEVEDFVDFLKQRAQAKPHAPPAALEFPVISVGPWPKGLSLSREDLYGDDGR
jgi:hypothetical protein